MPFWPHYPHRDVYILDSESEWMFGEAPANTDPITVPYEQMNTPNRTTVPSCFDVAPPGIEGLRGTVYYRRQLPPTTTPSVLYFAACAFYCRVLVDGVTLRDHRAGGYSPFWVPNVPAYSRELVVVVNNEFNATTAPTHTGGDFYNYGGITRTVALQSLVHVSSYHLRQIETFPQADLASVNVNIVLNTLVNGSSPPSSIRVLLQFDDASSSSSSSSSTPIVVPVNEGVGRLYGVGVPNAQPWSQKHPHLHTLWVQLLDGKSDNVIDSIVVRFGLRVLGMTTTAADNTRRLTINGEVVKLLGVNRHTMWPDTGSALTYAQVLMDVALLRKLGVTYVRGAHYPQDQRFLDLCDEAGIVVWEETLGPGVTVSDLQNPYFMRAQVDALNEMIDASINHPSVIFHAFYNEGPSDDVRALPGYNTSASTIRARVNNSRLVTWASNKQQKDVCLELADVVSFNGYPGWYTGCCKTDVVDPYWQSNVDWVRATWPLKPFFISETGGGGVYEWSANTTDAKWTQLYQDELVSTDVKFVLSNGNVTGLTLWQFNDIKANTGDTALCGQCVYAPHPPSLSVPWNCAYINVGCGRPGGENHKGMVDFWRREKRVFKSVASLYITLMRRHQTQT